MSEAATDILETEMEDAGGMCVMDGSSGDIIISLPLWDQNVS